MIELDLNKELDILKELLNTLNAYHKDNRLHLQDKIVECIIDQNLRFTRVLQQFEVALNQVKENIQKKIDDQNQSHQDDLRRLIEQIYTTNKLDFNYNPKDLALPSAWAL